MKKNHLTCKAHPYTIGPDRKLFLLGSDAAEIDILNDNGEFKKIPDIEKRNLLLNAAGMGNRRAIWIVAVGYRSETWSFSKDKHQSMQWHDIFIKMLKKDAADGDQEAEKFLEQISSLHLPKVD